MLAFGIINHLGASLGLGKACTLINYIVSITEGTSQQLTVSKTLGIAFEMLNHEVNRR